MCIRDRVLTCPEEILVSCEYLFDIEEGIFSDSDGNRDGSLDEDPLSEIFGNMYDAARYTQADRKHIVINDPDNPQAVSYTHLDSSATVEWTGDPGTIYEVTLTETAYDGCDATSTIFVTIEEAGAIACYDHLNVSIDNACGTVILSGTILTGEMEGNNTYEVFIIDIHGDTVPNATLTYEHVGQTRCV